MHVLLDAGVRYISLIKMYIYARIVMKKELIQRYNAERLLLQLYHNSQTANNGVILAGYHRAGYNKRMKLFYEKGRHCVSCGVEGEYIVLERNLDQPTPHLNMYTRDGQLMTVDHILPKKQGGKDKIKNLQPMCHKCNNRKGSLYGKKLKDVNWRELTQEQLKEIREKYK